MMNSSFSIKAFLQIIICVIGVISEANQRLLQEENEFCIPELTCANKSYGTRVPDPCDCHSYLFCLSAEYQKTITFDEHQTPNFLRMKCDYKNYFNPSSKLCELELRPCETFCSNFNCTTWLKWVEKYEEAHLNFKLLEHSIFTSNQSLSTNNTNYLTTNKSSTSHNAITITSLLTLISKGEKTSQSLNNEFCDPHYACETNGTGTKVPNPNDCHSYFLCISDSNSSTSVPSDSPIPCENESYFDLDDRKCKKGGEDCIKPCVRFNCTFECESKSPHAIADPNNCNRYFICLEGEKLEKFCPSENPFFDGNICTDNENSCCDGCTAYCSSTFIETLDPYDCESYYLCTEEGVPDESCHANCGPGKYFNSSSGLCSKNEPNQSCTSLCYNNTSTTLTTISTTTAISSENSSQTTLHTTNPSSSTTTELLTSPNTTIISSTVLTTTSSTSTPLPTEGSSTTKISSPTTSELPTSHDTTTASSTVLTTLSSTSTTLPTETSPTTKPSSISTTESPTTTELSSTSETSTSTTTKTTTHVSTASTTSTSTETTTSDYVGPFLFKDYL